MKKIVALVLSLLLIFTVAFTVSCKDEFTVGVKYFSQASDMIPMLKQGKLEIGLLPEPAATTLTKTASDKTWYRTDLQELYDGGSKAYPQAVMLVKQSFLNTYPDAVTEMAKAFSDNVKWVKYSVGDAVAAVNGVLANGVTSSLTDANVTADVVDGCKIYWQGASEAKQSVKNYIDDIIAIEKMSAVAVADDFFYDGQASGKFNSDTVKVVAPDGAPALAIAKFINDNEKFGTDKEFSYSVVAAGNIGAAVMQGTGDIVILPVNAASKLYKANSADTYKMVSVITHGNLYIMSSAPVASLADLAGKTVGVIGQGLVPDLTFKAVLYKNGMKIELAI